MKSTGAHTGKFKVKETQCLFCQTNMFEVKHVKQRPLKNDLTACHSFFKLQLLKTKTFSCFSKSGTMFDY